MNGAATAWIIVATALVLFMSLPGLALFYGGLVRARNVLSVFMHVYAIACLMSVLWLALGYTIAFGDVTHGWFGSLDKAFLSGVTADSLSGTLPEVLFFAFQMTFAIITPALIVGAYVERVGFGFVMTFSGLWMLLCYAPVVHWIWGGGALADGGIFGAIGTRDFAGGIVVHETAAIAALLIAIFLGPRKHRTTPPHAPWMVFMGAGMLWVGWFGFNGGSQLAADGGAAMAITVTHISAATASLSWAVYERIKYGKASLVGIVTGTIAGLACVWLCRSGRGADHRGDCRCFVSGSGQLHPQHTENRRHAGRVRGARCWRHLWHNYDRGLRSGQLDFPIRRPDHCRRIHSCRHGRLDQTGWACLPPARRSGDRGQRAGPVSAWRTGL